MMLSTDPSDDDLSGLADRKLPPTAQGLQAAWEAMVSSSPEATLDIAASAVAWLTGGRARAEVVSGAFTNITHAWVRVYALDAGLGAPSYLKVSAPEPLPEDDCSVLDALAGQTEAALRSASLVAEVQERAARERRFAQRFGKLQRTTRLLLEAAAAPEGPAAIARVLHQLTGLPVIIEDRLGQVISSCGDELFSTSSLAGQPDRDLILREALRSPTVLRHRDCLLVPAVGADDILAVVFLLDSYRRARHADRDALRQAAAVLAVHLAAVRATLRADPATAQAVLDHLLMGGDRIAAVSDAVALGLELDHTRVAVVMCERKVPDEFLLASLRRRVEHVALGGICTAHSGAVVFLVGEAVNWEALHAGAEHDLLGRCRIGVSGLCTDGKALDTFYRQAQEVLKLREIMSTPQPVTVFEDLGSYGLISELGAWEAQERFMHHWIKPLLDYDERRGGDLALTLSAYLEHGGSYAAAAEALSIHRSTLRYRLDRIRTLLGRDLSNTDTRFNLQAATRIWRTRRVLGESAGSAPHI